MTNGCREGARLCGALAGVLLLGAAAPAGALDQGDWLVRGRLVGVFPQDDSSAVSVGGAPLAGSEVSVDNGVTLDIDFSYMFTRNIGAELLLDLTSKHDIASEGTLAAVAPGTIIEARVLPPTLLLQYHFNSGGAFKPYVGAGINYTKFVNVKASGAGRAALGLSNVDLDSSWGFALQVGADYQLNDRWYLNADVKYIDVSTTGTANSLLGGVNVDVDIDPVLVGVGVGYRF